MVLATPICLKSKFLNIMTISETYLDIAYRQFKKSKINMFALYGTALIWVVAIFVPLFVSAYPLILIDEEGIFSPWFKSLFYTNGEELLGFLEVTTKRVSGQK